MKWTYVVLPYLVVYEPKHRSVVGFPASSIPFLAGTLLDDASVEVNIPTQHLGVINVLLGEGSGM